ncbi:MAG: hypothetical protein WCI50_02175 [Actinomycetes bacterium]
MRWRSDLDRPFAALAFAALGALVGGDLLPLWGAIAAWLVARGVGMVAGPAPTAGWSPAPSGPDRERLSGWKPQRRAPEAPCPPRCTSTATTPSSS